MKTTLEAMLEDHLKWKTEWSKEGSPGEFYTWLLERIEKAYAQRN